MIHVAIDIGASSGRVLVADTKQHPLHIEELHRFKNEFRRVEGHDRWNITQLVEEIIIGLHKVKEKGIEQCTVGIDTWAVDYCLLDKEGRLLGEPIAYRDERTAGAIEEFSSIIPKEAIYKKTGIQFLQFNTLYQLFREDKKLLDQAATLLLIPDYIAYCLTGKKLAELTNVSTTQYLNIHTRQYDQELLDAAHINLELLPPLVESGEIIGDLLPELKEKYDLPECTLIAVGTHDTASAVAGVPATDENWAYISSGTWSLIGVEQEEAITTTEAFEANYTNEGGVYQTYRFLKNCTGMWPIQEMARMLNYQYSYAEMAQEAEKVKPFLQYVDLNEERFTNPRNMIEEIQAYCRETGQVVPQSVGELTMCVYSNLALVYAREWKQLERLTGKALQSLHIVGGGANVALLNQLTADLIGKPVIAGPGEATAIGNLLVQMIASGELENLTAARKWVKDQISLSVYEPRQADDEKNI